MTQFTQLDEQSFDTQFGSVNAPDGGFFWDLDTDPAVLEQAHAERRLWTALDADNGGTVLVNRFAFVNRFAYVIAERPYPEGADIEAPMDGPDFCTQCDKAFTSDGTVPRAEDCIDLCVACYEAEADDDLSDLFGED